MIFVDTGAWFARFVPDDPIHQDIAQWFASNKTQLITTDYCLDEVLTLLSARGRPETAVAVGKLLLGEDLAQLHFLTRNQIERAWMVFQQQAQAGWSFTDCTSKVVIEDSQINSALALDRHFEQFGVQIIP